MSLIFWVIIELLFLFDKAPKYAFIKSDTTFCFLLWISKTLSRGVMPLPKSINQSVRKVSLVIDVLNQANILIEHSKSKLLRGHFLHILSTHGEKSPHTYYIIQQAKAFQGPRVMQNPTHETLTRTALRAVSWPVNNRTWCKHLCTDSWCHFILPTLLVSNINL